MKKTGILAILIAAIMVFCFTACDVFFGTTLGTPREWDPDQITITPDNLQELLRRAAMDAAFADALSLAIIREIYREPPHAEPFRSTLLTAGNAAIVKSSEIGATVLMDNITTLLDIINSDEFDGDAENLFLEMLRNLQKNFGKGERAAAHLIILLAGEITRVQPYEFVKTNWIDNANAIQAVLILTVVMLGEDELDDTSDLVDLLNFTVKDGKIHVNEPIVEPEPGMARTLAAYINYFTSDESDSAFSDYIKQAFGL